MSIKRRDQARAGRKARKQDREQGLGGFTGLEGDFEAERRRAAAATAEHIEPYEDDSLDRPVFPEARTGLTHP
jgi:hypothetical protein